MVVVVIDVIVVVIVGYCFYNSALGHNFSLKNNLEIYTYNFSALSGYRKPS